LRYKLNAIIEGLSISVTRIPCNSRHLLQSLASNIPVDQLTFSWIDRTVKVLANRVFEWNLRVIK